MVANSHFQAISLRTPVNEFYKKGCQEKSSTSTGGSRFFLEDPAHLVSLPRKTFGLLYIS